MHAVLTGPIQGTVTLANGTVVDVSPAVVTVPDQATADEVAHLIGLRYAAEGHPEVEQPFRYDPPNNQQEN